VRSQRGAGQTRLCAGGPLCTAGPLGGAVEGGAQRAATAGLARASVIACARDYQMYGAAADTIQDEMIDFKYVLKLRVDQLNPATREACLALLANP
jgi:hypothetical protein